ncbi:MAG: methylmalonyl-CoA mutase family protein, partial [Oscillospiraceae bacterium]
TDTIEKEILEYLDEIEHLGGSAKCIEEGYFQKKLADGAYQFQKSVDDGERTIVGVNKYRDENEPDIPTFALSNETEQRQKAKLDELRRTRDNVRVVKALERIEKDARANENLAEAMIEAADAYATLGEICGVLKKVYGKYIPMRIY